ncbi:hypothetical protein [Xanthomonas hortorum]|uniref:hypothetical protein n=1 Tax=Xanthomonas hortorum TaxID=56454 RepID=UPI001594B437|nr:hypothetical protein [Xanthomonas hortorum]NHF68430.1 hypothetical protein [Xanthomonas hortorum]
MDEYESKLDKLAWLSLTKPGAVTLEDLGLTPDDLSAACELVEGRPLFSDPEEAKARAVRHLQTAIIAPLVHAPPELFQELQQCRTEPGSARKANLPGRALAQLHNAGEIDALRLAIEAVQAGTSKLGVVWVLSESLPLFDDIDIRNLLVLIGLLGAQGFVHGAAGEWMKLHPAAIERVVEACVAVPGPTLAPLLRVALIHGVGADRAPGLARIHALTGEPNQLVSMPAIEAIGYLDWSGADSADIDKAVEVIRAGLRSDDKALRATAAKSGLQLVNTATDRHALIDEIAKLDEPYVAGLVGDHLAFSAEHLSVQSWYQDKIDLLAAKTAQDMSSSHGLDHILARQYQSPEKARCLAWLEAWALANADSAPSLSEAFHEFFQSLVQDLEELGALLARWLMHDDLGIQNMTRKILGELGLQGVYGLAFPALVLDGMTSSSLRHLVRRTLANVVRDEQKVSLVWSLTCTDSAETRTFSLVHEAMANFVGYDYPSATKEYLEAVASAGLDSPLAKLAKQILDSMSRYYDAFKELPQIEELRPLSEQQHHFAKEHRRLMNEAFEEASKDSIFRQIATTIPLKAGRSMFFMRNGQMGDKAQMISTSHSVAVPRSESIDKVGSDLRRRRFILAKPEPETT